ncbi:PadR family transcriptional regulator [Spongiactinospora gelatinilytica]|uniref:PadR family transcriptional regulator n=1 Tax=Spongiactinospora gelatinilytica TaxID=2666298 RepID=A0A2W2EJU4_9ACTN|nr:PadR family transcriptional regulator [Spongiactinospora gelatinilytica]PZG22593.1 PadR family transcriptional regulator [Spongiactinospora gelatinilytica]
MSPVFGHGRLRLYLLKLLEESPRHGYEVIRLLQDRFLGVYSPSPGTIYPRLARLEDEGLVTHEVIEGKKVFSLTDKGRAELAARMDEIADLEVEISRSVRDIAREVKEDVRDTVKSLREELTQMARDVRKETTAGMDDGRGRAARQKAEWKRLQHEQQREWQRLAKEHSEQWRRQARNLRDESERWTSEWRGIWSDVWTSFGGVQDPGRQADLDGELGDALADFVAHVRQDASNAPLSEATVEQCRAILIEASARIRDVLR